MNALHDLSLAYKTPLRITALVLVTASLITTAFIAGERNQLRQDLIGHSQAIARVLANTLVEPIAHDDAWRAYEIINAPFHRSPDPGSTQAEIVMVLDARHMIYVSTRPNEYPMLANPARVDAGYASVERAVAEAAPGEPTAIVSPQSGALYVVMPILSDGVELGTLVMGYSGSVFAPRFAALVQRAGLVTGAVLALLLPAGWIFGRLVAQPLVDLARAMGRVGPHVSGESAYVHRYRGRDEIGRLGLEFQRMLASLREKEALEKQMIAADRLAAIGRLTAGIAHEINNPLGGMLNAISTHRRHGQADAITGRTLSLIERGLRQIQETVAALLVEARVESHALTHQDVEDTRTLVLADAQAKSAQLDWHNGIDSPLALPSTPTRQILINLLLNAVHAVGPGGHIGCSVGLHDGRLQIEVVNDGQHIPPDKLQYLFEPFSLLSRDGHGLGLWVTYQIVQQLGGSIHAASDPGRTRFRVELPRQGADERQPETATVPG